MSLIFKQYEFTLGNMPDQMFCESRGNQPVCEAVKQMYLAWYLVQAETPINVMHSRIAFIY